ncbi:hypothetical protein J2Y00_003598 [Deinococcus soli (ex Cha et al. 2016)]|uniref:Uncharacterized protein n=1 Tax=Deinococcus soli (ex Cha et al. 2016) TaxID=1309411 RepID=A0AAE3XEK9_9DEIO|nr:hypothetical protein [Deinococcus soli (ex Cha et al. 2016)]MDR6219987.1 hypothetical protein [Deinococcus soli (ex Cha et al. 2016)]
MAQGRQSVKSEEQVMALLSPILALDHVESTTVDWRKTVHINNLKSVEVTCVAGRNQVVPCGADVNVLIALTNLYYQQGQPKNGCIQVSVQDLCNAVGLSDGKINFDYVHQSLQRWLTVRYEVIDFWDTPNTPGKRNFCNLHFGIITTLEQLDLHTSDIETIGDFHGSTILKITLNRILIDIVTLGRIINDDT